MLYKALKTFVGSITMTEGEVREISDSSIVNDLMRAGYIEEAKATVKQPKKPVRKKKQEG